MVRIHSLLSPRLSPSKPMNTSNSGTPHANWLTRRVQKFFIKMRITPVPLHSKDNMKSQPQLFRNEHTAAQPHPTKLTNIMI